MGGVSGEQGARGERARVQGSHSCVSRPSWRCCVRGGVGEDGEEVREAAAALVGLGRGEIGVSGEAFVRGSRPGVIVRMLVRNAYAQGGRGREMCGLRWLCMAGMAGMENLAQGLGGGGDDDAVNQGGGCR